MERRACEITFKYGHEGQKIERGAKVKGCVHFFGLYQDGEESNTLAVCELENGALVETSPEYVRFTEPPPCASTNITASELKFSELVYEPPGLLLDFEPPQLPSDLEPPQLLLDFEPIESNQKHGLFFNRAKVPGGWIVLAVTDVLTHLPEQSLYMQSGYEWRNLMTFVPDPKHLWR